VKFSSEFRSGESRRNWTFPVSVEINLRVFLSRLGIKWTESSIVMSVLVFVTVKCDRLNVLFIYLGQLFGLSLMNNKSTRQNDLRKREKN
jgi:hypothetical protein